jgi:DNA invertase Pin-like site-specific DNA recombinase
MANRAAIYTRISTGEQNSDLQTTELPEFCAHRGWHLAETYSDVMTGAKDKRPALDRLMADARRGKFSVVAVWRFDRFARSTSHLLWTLEEFSSPGIDFVSVTESIDTSTLAGRMVFTVLGAVAELERCIIRERVIAGQRAAKRRGVKLGRPSVAVDAVRVLRLRESGLNWRAIAAETGVPKDTLRRSQTSAMIATLSINRVRAGYHGEDLTNRHGEANVTAPLLDSTPIHHSRP